MLCVRERFGGANKTKQGDGEESKQEGERGGGREDIHAFRFSTEVYMTVYYFVLFLFLFCF